MPLREIQRSECPRLFNVMTLGLLLIVMNRTILFIDHAVTRESENATLRTTFIKASRSENSRVFKAK